MTSPTPSVADSEYYYYGESSSSAIRNNAAARIASANADTLLCAAASNKDRKGLFIYNESTSALYVCIGTGAASITTYTFLVPANTLLTMPTRPGWQGMVRGIWAAANGFAQVTEFI